MKKMMFVWLVLAGTTVFAQSKVDEVRMQRDIEVAENILGTLIKQQYGRRQFIPIEVQGSYLPGYGVTFRVPSEMFGNMFFISGDNEVLNFDAPPEPPVAGVVYRSYSSGNAEMDRANAEVQRSQAEADRQIQVAKRQGPQRSKNTSKGKKTISDSSRLAYHEKLMEAAKDFIADYGDLLSQLPANEKIIITNKGEGQNLRLVWAGFEKQKLNMVTVEGNRSDVNLFRQGKITRDQLLTKLSVVNSEVSDELQPDLELLTSIFNRLYSRDLSRTFFCDENIYYESLKDYGVIYHMQVYASNLIDNDEHYAMPTVRLTDLDQEARDKKVKELYPEFEKNVKEDLLEYGRTLKSLKNEEVLTFEIQMTRCKGCNIPSFIELSLKNSTLKDYASGKITKEAAIAKMTVKKGPDQ